MNTRLTITTIAMFLILTSIVQAAAIHPYKCDGTATNELDEGDDLCVYGTGFAPDSNIDLYVVNDLNSYDNGQLIVPENSKTTVATSSSGILALTKIWENVKKGFFDLIADINQDGEISEGDVINIKEGYGLKVSGEELKDEPNEIPEFGTIGAALALIGANYVIWKRRR